MFNKKIVRYTTLDGEPVQIGSHKKNSSNISSDSENDEDENKIDEETLNTMLAEIAAKEQRAIEKLKDADIQAGILKQQTQNECNQIIEETKEQAQKIREESKQQGYSEGFAQGKSEGETAVRQEMSDLIKRTNEKAEKTLQDAKEQTAEYFIRAEDDIVSVLMLAIEKILPQHFLDVPQVVLPIVRNAIQQVRDQKEIKVHVEPDSYDLVLMARSEFQSMLTDGTAILEIISDETLNPGDCVIETPNGGVDARLLTQIELMKNSIQSVLNR